MNKISKIDKKYIAEKTNTNLKTLYNWEENRPEIYKYLVLGLEYEQKLEKLNSEENIINSIQKQLEVMNQKIDRLEK